MYNLGPIYVAKKIARGVLRRLKNLTKTAEVCVVPAFSAQQWKYIEIEPAADVSLDRPANFSSSDWSAYRIRDVSTIPPAFVLDLKNAYVVGKDGWVSPDLKTVVDDVWSEVGFPTSRMLSSLPKTATQNLAGTSVVLAVPWMPNYYHWTLQALPRVYLADQIISRNKVDNWIIPNKPPGYVRQWLERLQIDPGRLVEADEGAIFCERLIVPAIPSRNRYIPTWVVDFVRNNINLTDTGIRKIFLARKQSEQRKIANLEETRKLLGRYGFEDIEMDGKTIDQQASLFSSADIIVGVLGAGLTNLVYARPEAQVVELMPSNLTFPCYQKLSKSVGLKYHAIVGTEPRVPYPFYKTDAAADLCIDVIALDHLLSKIVN